ncbi:MAG: hypothetical protein ACO1N2_01605 [Candidatus Saccharimonadota bacterium]|jgi:hypothetical protein
MSERLPAHVPFEAKRSDYRLFKSSQILMMLQQDIKGRSVEGLENISQLDETPVIAVSHSTGYDFPFAIATLGEKLNFAVADQSTHHELGKEFSAYLWNLICGRNNLVPVSYSWVNGQKRADRFNPEDAEPMARMMSQRKSMMIAAHSPLKVDVNGNAIPPRPGYLAAYVAGKTQAPILPVGVSYEPILGGRKHNAVLRVGAPFELEGTADTATIRELSALQRKDMLTSDETEALSNELLRLRMDGKKVLDVIQSLQNLEHGYPVIDNAYTQEID